LDIVEIIERESPWDGQQANSGRNPNFRKNQNQNSGKNIPDQNIRPPFQENYVEASHSEDLEQETQINLMGLDDEEDVFLTHDDQESIYCNNSKPKQESHLISDRDMTFLFLRYISSVI